MRRLTLVAVVICAFLLSACAWQMGRRQATKPLPPFQMVVEFSQGSLKAQCVKGCAWVTVTYGCEDARPTCKAEIDERGIGGAGR